MLRIPGRARGFVGLRDNQTIRTFSSRETKCRKQCLTQCVCACTCVCMHVCTPMCVRVCMHVCTRSVAQSCLTLCKPMDCSPPGSSVHEFSRQEYWNVLPFPPPGIFLTQGSNPCLLCLLHCRRSLYLLNHWGSSLTQYIFQKIVLGKQQYHLCQYSHAHVRLSVPPQGSLLGSDVYSLIFVLIILNMWHIFISRRARPSSLFLCKWALVSLGPLYILINCRISLAVSKTKSIDFNWQCHESIDNLGIIDIITILKLSIHEHDIFLFILVFFITIPYDFPYRGLEHIFVIFIPRHLILLKFWK